jgi:RNA polymerase sigma-B factor
MERAGRTEKLLRGGRGLSTATPQAEDIKQLFERLRRAGDRRAREELVTRFLPLARRLAARYSGAGETHDDLFQVASLGLVKAVDRFDHSRGVAFTTYAVPTISGELKRHFRDNSWAVHVPRGMRDNALKVHATIRDVSESTGERPPNDELAERLSMSERQVDDALGALGAFDAISLDSPAYHGSDAAGQTRGETVGAVDAHYELAEDRATLQEALKQIPSRDRRVLQMRFLEDRTQSDIADHIGVSQMQVSRILRRALERLRQAIDGHEHQLSRPRRASALAGA